MDFLLKNSDCEIRIEANNWMRNVDFFHDLPEISRRIFKIPTDSLFPFQWLVQIQW